MRDRRFPSPATRNLVLATCLLAFVFQSHAGPIVEGELAGKIDECLKRLVPFGFSGSVLIAKDDKIILQNGYGLADRTKKTPITTDTVFDIGSITKQFTGAAILKLEMQGKLSVQDPITKYFKEVPADKTGMTLHHLLTHSSGLQSDFGGDYDAMTRDGIVEAAMKSKLQWPPGTRYAYSNAGYSLLAAIAEQVSGQLYESFLQEHLFKPAEMQKTGYRLPSWSSGDLARGYSDGKDHGTPLDHKWADDGPYWNLRGNGGILSTPADMYRWHQALSGDAVLSSAAKEKYYAPHVPEGPAGRSHYAYGWVILKTPRGTKLITHNGGSDFGFHADFRRYVEENTVIFIATNGEMRADPVDQQMTRMLFGMEYSMPPKATEVHSTILNSYAGSYETTTGTKLRVTAHDGRLDLAAENQAALNLLFGVDAGRQARIADLNARASAIIEALAKKDYAPIHAALKVDRPLEETQARYEPYRKNMEDEHGVMKSFELLGSIPGEESVSTGVRLIFEKGSEGIQLVWEEDRLRGLRLSPADPSFMFVPESMTDFAGFRLNAAAPPRISFRLAGHGGMTLMTVHASEGDVIGKKTQ